MKATFVGGGSLRLLGVLREAMAEKGIFEGGQIYLHDLDVARAEAMGRMLMKTPEYRKVKCKIRWGKSLEAALAGADVVGVILMAGSRRAYRIGGEISRRHGFLSSDNISPNAAFLALKGGQILLDIARKMERLCPDAWLLDFANPISVLSGAVNHYTRIRAVGVCEGFTNHQWDIPRLLGSDEQNTELRVETAGVNHMSFIRKATLRNRDVFAMLDRRLKSGLKMPRLQKHRNAFERANIRNSVTRLAEIYREYGVLLFSTEPEGLWHLRYEKTLDESLAAHPPLSRSEVLKRLNREQQSRIDADRHFRSFLDRDLPDEFWEAGDHTFSRSRRNVIALILKGAAGLAPVRVVTSYPNRGAIAGIKDRTIVEYSQILYRRSIKPEGHYELPNVVHGIVSAVATHQTMLVDAIGTRDPRLFAHALLAYPVRPYSEALRAMCRELLKANLDEIPSVFRKTLEYL